MKKVKGKAHPIRVHKPLSANKDPRVASKDKKAEPQTAKTIIIGRKEEQKVIRGHLEDFANKKQKQVLLMEGDAGQGLSRMIQFLETEAIKIGITVRYGF